MKPRRLLISLFALSAVFYMGCSSGKFDIEEVEEEYEEKEVVNKPPEEKKVVIEEPKVEPPKEEYKPKITSTFTVQIGAYRIESNAMRFLERARLVLSREIYYKVIDGLYKFRLGEFKSKSDAMSLLNEVKQAGFWDSFIALLK